MAAYTVLSVFGSAITSPLFFQPGATFLSSSAASYNLTNPDGTIVNIVGTGFAVNGSNQPTAGTVTDITLYFNDFAIQFAGFSSLSGVALVDLYDTWLGAAPSDVFRFLLPGDDTVSGSEDNDILSGHDGNDTLTAGTGDDVVEPGAGDDSIDGGGGTRDILSYADASLDPLVTKGVVADLSAASITDPWGGTDTFAGIEGLRGTKFADTLTGDAGANRFEGLDGADTFAGGAGQDQIRYNRDAQYGGTAGVTVFLGTGSATDGFGKTDLFTGIEAAVGTNKADTMVGGNIVLDNGNSYEIYGLAGDDIITAGSFDLYVEPGAGNDTITGGAGGGDQVSYAEYTGASGATFDLPAGKITDPYGGTDTLIGNIEGVRGTRNADVIIGNGLNNFLRGLAGNDTIKGGGGTDMVRYDRDAQYGGAQGVTVDLAAGTATDGFGNADTLESIENVRGTAFGDVIFGDANANLFQGMAGDDLIDGRGGLDTIDYTADVFFGATVGVTVHLGDGIAMDPFGGTDTLVSIEIARGTNVADTLIGGNTILPGNNIWELRGLDGNDTLIAGAYDAILFPGANDDTITGGAGIDQVSYEEYTGANGAVINLATGIINDPYGGTDTITSSGFEGVRGTRNADTIIGNSANNFFRGLAGNDTMDGGDGIDMVRYDRDGNAGGTKAVTVDLAAGTATDGFGNTDTLKNIENVRGTGGADTLLGDDKNNLFQGLGGADTFDGRGGQDMADYSADGFAAGITGVIVNLATGKATDGQGAIDTLISIEGARGTGGDDTLIGGDLDLGFGNAWNLQGRNGNDTLIGGAASLYAEPGAGNDTITGGAGKTDQISYADFTNGIGVTVDLGKGVVIDPLGGTDTFTGLEGVRGTNFADTLIGDAGDNFFNGLGGDDGIAGGDGIDLVRYDRDAQYGGTGAVTVDLAAGTAIDGFGSKDTLSGIENIRGGIAGDTLLGDSGANRIQGLAGADTINGRDGFDIVDYSRDASEGGSAGVKVDLGLGSATDGFGAVDTLLNIEGIVGTAKADELRGNGLANRIQGGEGDDLIDGAGGIDTAVFSGPMASYTILGTPAAFQVIGPDGTDSLTGIEFLEFADGTLSTAASVYALSANISQAEGSGGGDNTVYTYTLTRTGGSAFTHVISGGVTGIAGAGTTPANAADFSGGVFPSGSVTFAPGQTKQTIDIEVVRDNTPETNERFQLALAAAPAGATIAVGTTQGIILNDDSTVAIAATSANKPEGNGGGTTTFTFTLTRSGATLAGQSVDWSVAGIAGAGTTPATAADFPGGVFPTGTVSFAAGQTSQVITVNVNADATVETADRFAVTLANPSPGVTLGTASAQGIIQNDDALLSIAATSANKPEGNAGTTAFTFTVTRTGQTTVPHTADWSVAGIAGTGTTPATAADFPGGVFPTGTVSFTAGQTSQVVTVNVAADTGVEANDRFAITLANPSSGASLGTASANGIILNDDTNSLSIAAASANKPEGSGGGTTAFTFTVVRTSASGPQTVNWAVAGATGAGTAPADAADFAGAVLPSGIVSFAAGVATQTVTVNVVRDALGELNERFAVTLSGASGGTPITTATAQGIIQNDDISVAIGPASQSVIEGNSGTTTVSFTVSRGGSTVAGQTVAWSVAGAAGGGTNPADSADFAGGVLPGGVVTFGAGQTTQVVKVALVGDTNVELNERFAVSLSAPSHGATLSSASAQALILTDEFSSTSANQTLTGTAGPDIFLLGGGLDTVIGKAGLDIFRFRANAVGPAGSNATNLQDFSRAAGEVIDLSAIDALAFNFINTAAFSGAAMQLRWQDNGATRLIQGDVNGDMIADLTITTPAAGPIDSNWFVL